MLIFNHESQPIFSVLGGEWFDGLTIKETVMNAKIAVAVLVAVLGLIGCAAAPVVFDPNRPYPPQPTVSEKIRSELASKKMQEMPIFVSSRINYYDGSDALKIWTEVEKSGRKASFTNDFPKLEKPPAETVANSRDFLEYFKEQLKTAGFSKVETPCEECLITIADYSDFKVGSTIHILARVRVYYLGQEIVLPRDDRMIKWRKGLITLPGSEMDVFIKLTATRAVDEMLQAWNANIATASRQRISAVQ